MAGYITSTTTKNIKIDLGLARNPFGANPVIRKINLNDISKYPVDLCSQKASSLIRKFWGINNDKNTVIFSGNGSYGAGDEVVRLLFKLGCKDVLTRPFSFPNVIQWVERHSHKNKYIPIQSPNCLDPIVSTMEICKLSKKDIRGNIVYLDFPQNPFGWADDEPVLAAIKRIQANGGVVISDLAFGEYLLDKSRKIARQTLLQNGVILGTLSKGQGLPGLRIGYAILSEDISKQFGEICDKDRMVMDLNCIAQGVVSALFKCNKNGSSAEKFAIQSSKKVRKANAGLSDLLKKLDLEMLPTNPSVPIQVIKTSKDINLHDWLLERGVQTESLDDYKSTLPENEQSKSFKQFVRILTPANVQELSNLLNK